MERKVIHLNIADFSVAVERLIDNTLRSRPLIIAPQASRSVVYDMSEEAYQDGVRKGMLLSTARNRCRGAIVLPPQQEQYRKMLVECFHRAKHFTPLVECSNGNGHLYLDVTGTHRLFGPPPDIGWRLRKMMIKDLGLDPIWSVAPNKLIAKVASRLVKPVGEYIVAAGEEESFLAPLPVALLPGIAPTDLYRLRGLHISKAHQVAALSVEDLSVICGNRARALYQAVRGIDQAPVLPPTACDGGGSFTHIFSPDTNQVTTVRAALATLVSQAGYNLRQGQFACRRVGVQLLYTDGVEVIRQAVTKYPAADDAALQQLALTALYRAWHRRVRLRQLTLLSSQYCRPVQQLSLFEPINHKKEKNKKISNACDVICQRYGSGFVKRGIQLGQQTVSHTLQ